jgi:predicted esterase
MSEMIYDTLHRQLMSLYSEGAYAPALELLQQETDNFPDKRGDTCYWGMCLASRLNDLPLALQYFKSALADGNWFAPSILREDEDLKPLQGLPEFEQMVEVCRQKQAEVEAHVKPELLVIPPEGEAGKYQVSSHPLLLALHGNTGNAHAFADSWHWVSAQGWLLALPQSSQVVSNNAFVWNDFDKATREVKEHYAAITKQYAIEPGKVVVGGFSMGGGLAIWLSVSRAIKARGFVVLGPYLPKVDVLQPYLEAAKTDGLRGYVILGEQELPQYQEQVRKVVDLLNAHGIPCELEPRSNLAHAFPPDFEKSLQKAFAFILQE